MGLVALLAATIIIILLLVFGNYPLSPFNLRSFPTNPKNIENKARDAVNSTNEKTRLEYDQTKQLDLP